MMECINEALGNKPQSAAEFWANAAPDLFKDQPKRSDDSQFSLNVNVDANSVRVSGHIRSSIVGDILAENGKLSDLIPEGKIDEVELQLKELLQQKLAKEETVEEEDIGGIAVSVIASSSEGADKIEVQPASPKVTGGPDDGDKPKFQSPIQ